MLKSVESYVGNLIRFGEVHNRGIVKPYTPQKNKKFKRSNVYLSKKRQQNEIYKIPFEKVVEAKDYKLKDYTDEKAQLQGETVKIMDNLVFKKIRDYYKEHKNDKELSVDKLAKDIVNVVMPMNSTAKNMYMNLADIGFKINDIEMKRLMSGSGQIRRNTVTFIKKKLYNYISNSLLCGLTLEDFGDNFNAAKFNAYFGLYMSGCLLLKDFVEQVSGITTAFPSKNRA